MLSDLPEILSPPLPLSSDETHFLCCPLYSRKQAGPLEKVFRPRDHQQKQPRPFAFVTYEHEESVPYAVELFQGTSLYGRALRLQAQGAQVLLCFLLKCAARMLINYQCSSYIILAFKACCAVLL